MLGCTLSSLRCAVTFSLAVGRVAMCRLGYEGYIRHLSTGNADCAVPFPPRRSTGEREFGSSPQNQSLFMARKCGLSAV